MRNRAFRPIAALLCIIALTGVPAQAGPVAIREVIQVMNSSQNPPDLRLRTAPMNSAIVASGVHGAVRPAAVDDSTDSTISSLSSGFPINTDSLLSGITLSSDPQTILDISVGGDVEGTVCDCGEIAIVGGGFPKWPLLFLAGIPLFFIQGDDDGDDDPRPTPTPTTTPTIDPRSSDPTPNPTPTPTPPAVPEPASLFLFGTGLAAFGAGLRRRYSKAKVAAQTQATEGE